MPKDLVASVGKYEKNGESKYQNVKVGVIMERDGREFALIDPTVNLAGVLAKQNMLNHAEGKQMRDSVMCAVFDNSNRQQQAPAQQAPAADSFDDELIPF